MTKFPRLLPPLLLGAMALAQEPSLGEAAHAASAQSAAQPATRVYTNRDVTPASPPQTPPPPTATKKPEPPPETNLGEDASADRETQRQCAQRVARLLGQLALAQAQFDHLQKQFLSAAAVCDQSNGDDARTCKRQVEQYNQHLTELLATQHALLGDLSTQLQAAKEAARHAGAPHVDDIPAQPAGTAR